MNGSAEISLRYDPRPQDVAAIRAIVESTGMFHVSEVAIAEELILERLARGVPSGYHFVFAELSGVVAAYACYGPIEGTANSYDLFWIAVLARHQRLGLGRLLLAEVERLVGEQGGGQIYAETSGREQYLPTRAFYERFGYANEARLANFYAPGDDKVIYVKRISG